MPGAGISLGACGISVDGVNVLKSTPAGSDGVLDRVPAVFRQPGSSPFAACGLEPRYAIGSALPAQRSTEQRPKSPARMSDVSTTVRSRQDPVNSGFIVRVESTGWPGSIYLSLPFISSALETLEFCIATGYPFRHV